MKNYDLELSIVLDDHGFQQALGLQAKTGRNKSKIIKMYNNGNTMINSDGSVSVNSFAANKTVRINFIGHGNAGSSEVSDTAGLRTWTPADLVRDVRAFLQSFLPARSVYLYQRLSMIVCYGGGHTYTTQNEYGHHIHPSNSFGYKFFDLAKGWVTDMTARGDISTTRTFRSQGNPGSLNFANYTGAQKLVGNDDAHKDKYRKVRFYQQNGTIQVEWPYEGYD